MFIDACYRSVSQRFVARPRPPHRPTGGGASSASQSTASLPPPSRRKSPTVPRIPVAFENLRRMPWAHLHTHTHPHTHTHTHLLSLMNYTPSAPDVLLTHYLQPFSSIYFQPRCTSDFHRQDPRIYSVSSTIIVTKFKNEHISIDDQIR